MIDYNCKLIYHLANWRDELASNAERDKAKYAKEANQYRQLAMLLQLDQIGEAIKLYKEMAPETVARIPNDIRIMVQCERPGI